MNLFNEPEEERLALFSKDGKHRLSLFRRWDINKPLAMFIGLNPSTANADSDDPTIKKIRSICKSNGCGGFYMTNLFTFISTNPKMLDLINGNNYCGHSDRYLKNISNYCRVVVFAWGNFDVIGRDNEIKQLFPKAKALYINKNGSPKHPLYCKSNTKFIDYTCASTYKEPTL